MNTNGQDTLEKQVTDLESKVLEEREETSKVRAKLYEEKQSNSGKRRLEKNKLMAEKSALEELEEAAEKWNNVDEHDEEGCCATYCTSADGVFSRIAVVVF